MRSQPQGCTDFVSFLPAFILYYPTCDRQNANFTHFYPAFTLSPVFTSPSFLPQIYSILSILQISIPQLLHRGQANLFSITVTDQPSHEVGTSGHRGAAEKDDFKVQNVQEEAITDARRLLI